MNLPRAILDSVICHAEKEYPKECCGWILSGKNGNITRALAISNAQDRYHEEDPKTFPRTSRNAYFMDPAELLAAHKSLRASNETLQIIYHSHIDAPALFSEEDTRMALENGEPLYPGVSYLIVSVREKKAAEYCLFRWNEKTRRFEASSAPLPV